jgi:hypothetical protein
LRRGRGQLQGKCSSLRLARSSGCDGSKQIVFSSFFSSLASLRFFQFFTICIPSPSHSGLPSLASDPAVAADQPEIQVRRLRRLVTVTSRSESCHCHRDGPSRRTQYYGFPASDLPIRHVPPAGHSSPRFVCGPALRPRAYGYVTRPGPGRGGPAAGVAQAARVRRRRAGLTGWINSGKNICAS